MGNIKIFADCHVFDGTLQGTTTYLKGLYLELIKDKTKTFFLAAGNIENLRTIFGAHENVQYVRYQSANKFFRLLVDIPLLLKKHRIDYAHFQYIVPPIKVCQYIVTIHDVLFLDFPEYFPSGYKIKNKLLFQWSARHSEYVLTVSDYSKQRIREHFQVDTTITSNAVDTVFFEAYDKTDAIERVKSQYGIQDYWLFVSRWEPRKNHQLLLKTFAEGQFYKQYQLVFIGDKALENPAYTAYFDSLDDAVKAKITVLRKVDFDHLLLLVRGATLSVYPSIAEGFGIPPLEALAANVPAVCSNTTAMSDFDFMSDCLFDPFDPADLNSKIRLALQDSHVAQKRAAIVQKYTWQESARQFCRAISQKAL